MVGRSCSAAPRFPHCATAQTHLHLAHLRFGHKGHHQNSKISPSLDDHVFHVGRRDPGAVRRADPVYGECPGLPQGFLYYTQNKIHDVRDHWRHQRYNALQYQQEQFEYAVQEHQREANEQIEIAVALATSRKAAQMIFIFKTLRIMLRRISVINSEDYHCGEKTAKLKLIQNEFIFAN